MNIRLPLFSFAILVIALSIPGIPSAQDKAKTPLLRAQMNAGSNHVNRPNPFNKLVNLRFLAITNKFVPADQDLDRPFQESNQSGDLLSAAFVLLKNNPDNTLLHYLGSAYLQLDQSLSSVASHYSPSHINHMMLNRLKSLYNSNEYNFLTFSGLQISMKWK